MSVPRVSVRHMQNFPSDYISMATTGVPGMARGDHLLYHKGTTSNYPLTCQEVAKTHKAVSQPFGHKLSCKLIV